MKNTNTSFGKVKLSSILPILNLIAKENSLNLSRVKEFNQVVNIYRLQLN